MSIAELVPASIAATEHGNALLEVAFLMSAVDGHLADEELAAFNELVARVRGGEATKAEIGALLEGFVFAAHTAGVPDRVREVAMSLPADLRAPAFTVAVALAMVDDDASAHEDALVTVLAEALGLEARVAELTAAAKVAAGTA
jgi:tellurite resistance protein